jgi:hypothetical protein
VAGAAGDGAEALIASEADRLVVEDVPLEGNPERLRVRGRGEVVREGEWRRGVRQQQEGEDRQGGDSVAASGDPRGKGARDGPVQLRKMSKWGLFIRGVDQSFKKTNSVSRCLVSWDWD